MDQAEVSPRLIVREATAADVPAMVALLGELFEYEHEFAADPAAQARGLQMIPRRLSMMMLRSSSSRRSN